MARRANRGISPVLLILLVLILAIGGLGIYVMATRSDDPYRSVSSLNVQDYLINANSLRGNVYKITGTVQNQLSWNAAKGRLFSIEILDEGTGGEFVPVVVPAEFNDINMQKGQTFYIKLAVGERGVLTAQQIQKS